MASLSPGSLFSYRDYRNLWISNLLVTIGASAFPIALAVTVLDAGGTTTTLGLIRFIFGGTRPSWWSVGRSSS
jgi:hypothetical protein